MSLTAVMTMREMLRPKCCSKSRVFGGDDGLTQYWRDVVVADDDAPLGGELADLLAVAGQEPRNRVRLVVVERADLGDVVGVGEEDAAERAEQRRDDEERDETGLAREPR